MNSTGQNTNIKGRVRIYDKDKSGSALQLYLETDEFEKYIIDRSTYTDSFFNLIDKDVIVDCKRYLLPEHPLVHIIVHSYQVV